MLRKLVYSDENSMFGGLQFHPVRGSVKMLFKQFFSGVL